MATRDIAVVAPARKAAGPVPAPAKVAPLRHRLVPVGIWVAGALVYAAVGALQPWLLLLGVWQAVPAVLAVTWLVGRALRRLRR